MERNPYNPEGRGAGKYWLALAIGVTAVDSFTGETLSNGFRRAIESENIAIKVGSNVLAWVTMGHLMDVIPEKIDPIDNLARGLGAVRDKLGEWTTRSVHIP